MNHKILITTILCVGLGMVSLAQADSTPTSIESEHWQEVYVAGFESAQFGPNVDLHRFRQFTVQLPEMEFSTHWWRQHRTDITGRDEQRIRTSYGEALQKALKDQITAESELSLATDITETTLVIVPTLTQFRLNAPDLIFGPRSDDYVDHVGATRITLELRDGQTDELLARLSDYKQTRSIGQLKATNRGVNLRDFTHLFQRWARRLGSYLGEAGASGG